MDEPKPKRRTLLLCHHRQDEPLVRDLARRLFETSPRAWRDQWDLIHGEQGLPETSRALREAACVVVCIGAQGMGRSQDSESQNAQRRALKQKGWIIPVLLPGAPEGKPEPPDFLSRHTWVDLRKNSEEGFHQLSLALQKWPMDPGLPPSNECPYRGLQHFEPEHSRWFFGRRTDIEHLLGKLRRDERFLLISGPSGSGKSSLVLAGLLPSVTQGRLDPSQEWSVLKLRPGARPCHALALSLYGLGGGAEPVSDVQRLQRLREGLRANRETLSDHVDLTLSQAPRPSRVLLIVDQLEELFTQCQDAAERDAFLEGLVHAMTVDGGRVHVVATVRSDFLGHCQENPRLSQQLNSATCLMRTLTQTELHETVREPARMSGIQFEPGLEEELVHAVREQPGDLPLLQFALLQLWKERWEHTLTWEGYRRMGGLKGAIASSAEESFLQLTEAQQRTARRVFTALVIVGDGTGDTRRRVSHEELRGLSAEASAVLERFIVQRLLVADEESVELAHEALVRGWERLRGWLEEEREVLLLRQEVTRAAELWERAGRASDELWRGGRLARAQDLNEALEPHLTVQGRDFLRESREARQRAREKSSARRRRERELTRLSVARMLAMRSAQVRPLKPLLSLLLAREALRHKDNEETRSELYAALMGSTLRQIIEFKGGSRQGGTNYFRLSSDGRKLFVCAGKRATLRSVEGKLLKRLPLESGDVQFAAFSPDNQWLAVVLHRRSKLKGQAVSAWIFDTRGKLVSTLSDSTQGVSTNRASFSPDGQLVLTGHKDGHVRLWRRSGELLSKQFIGGGSSHGWFSPDGARILVIATEHRIALLWTLQSGEVRELIGHEHRIIHGSWSPNGRHVLTIGRDNTARLWDLEGQAVAVLTGHTGPLTKGSFNPVGNRILTVSEDCTARIWNLSGETLLTLREASTLLHGCDWSPTGQHLMAHGRGGVYVYRADGKHLITLRESEDEGCDFPAWSADGRDLFTSSWTYRNQSSRSARIELRAVESVAAIRLPGHRSALQRLAPQPHGSLLLTLSYDCVCLSDENGVLLHRIAMPGAEADESRGFNGVCWDPTGERFLTYGFGGLAWLWDRHGKPIHALQGAADHQGSILHACFSPDGSWVLTVSNDGTGRLWNSQGQEVLRLGDHYFGIEYGEFSPTMRYVLTVDAHEQVAVWDIHSPALEVKHPRFPHGPYDLRQTMTAQPLEEALALPPEESPPLASMKPYKAARLAFLTQGQFLIASSPAAQFIHGENHIVLATPRAECVDLTGHAIRQLSPHQQVSCCAPSPDGRRILLGYEDGTAEIQDSADGSVLQRLKNEAPIVLARWAPDSSRLFTLVKDGRISLWEAGGSRLAVLPRHAEQLSDVAFHDQGQTLVTAAGSVVWLWPATRDGLLALAEKRALRDFTPEERERYLAQLTLD